jgi:hypothetical protein
MPVQGTLGMKRKQAFGVEQIDLSHVASIRAFKSVTVKLSDIDLNYIEGSLWASIREHASEVLLWGPNHGNSRVLLKQCMKTRNKIIKARKEMYRRK